jgi:nucleoside phosphorylase
VTQISGRFGRHARLAVLTIIDEEFEAVRNDLGANYEVDTTGAWAPISQSVAIAQAGKNVKYLTYPFVVAQAAERSNTPANEQIRRLIERFRPEVFVVIGVAGGVQRPELISNDEIRWTGPVPGDIVVANYVHYADYTASLPQGEFLRYYALDHPSAVLITDHARAIKYYPWHETVKLNPPLNTPLNPPTTSVPPSVHIGEIVATESIRGNPTSEDQVRIVKLFDKALAIDMESAGVGRSLHDLRCQYHYNPIWICVRAISDSVRADDPDMDPKIRRLADPGLQQSNKSERDQWKKYAAAVAAAYARQLIARLLSSPRAPTPRDPGAGPWSFPPDNNGVSDGTA